MWYIKLNHLNIEGVTSKEPKRVWWVIMVYVTLYVLTLVKKFKKMLQKCLKIFKNCLYLSYSYSCQNIILVPFLKRTHFSTFFSISSTHCNLLAFFFLRQKVNLKTLETFKNLILELFKSGNCTYLVWDINSHLRMRWSFFINLEF